MKHLLNKNTGENKALDVQTPYRSSVASARKLSSTKIKGEIIVSQKGNTYFC